MLESFLLSEFKYMEINLVKYLAWAYIHSVLLSRDLLTNPFI